MSVQPVPSGHSNSELPNDRLSVLVVDDSAMQRRILAGLISRWGFDVTEAASAEEALEICAQSCPDLILSDWIMPGMTGLEFCQTFRRKKNEHYSYFILLTTKSGKEDVAQGLEAGADDFLSKPVDGSELRARLIAGQRILRIQRELAEKNKLILSTLTEMQRLYASIDSDLLEAKKLQQSLMRDKYRQLAGGNVSLMLRSCGHVGGDLVGFFSAGPGHLGLFAIDVSGHGVSSALMTARLAGYLSDSAPEQNIALKLCHAGGRIPRPPVEAIRLLNEMVLSELSENEFSTDHYFTMLLAHIDLATGRVVVGQAGHPHPIIQRSNGNIEREGTGGFPVGLMPDAEFAQFEFNLAPGDRLLIMSDGVTECPDRSGSQLGDDRADALIRELANVSGPAFFEALVWRLSEYCDSMRFPDDISGILFEYDPVSRRSGQGRSDRRRYRA
ncbi:SpoIIE family protein phosphatase [Sulfitobacter sp. LCG007]